MPLTQVDQGLLGQYAQYTGFKNKIINGQMQIDQRNAGASVTVTTSTGYTLDRWNTEVNQSSKFSIQQNAGSVTPPSGYINYLGCTSLSAYSVGASDFFLLSQSIEGLNCADLGWGTANAQTVTISFWVRSSLTGTFGATVNNNAQNRTYPFTYTISSANTWEQKTATIPGDTSGTWLTTNGVGVRLRFGLGVGSTYSGTAGAWTGTSNIFGVTGATSVVGTNGATFYITGVQLEKGSTATSFDYRPYGTELALCQRYYTYVGGENSVTTFCVGQAYSSTSTNSGMIFFPVPMRASPTFSYRGTLSNYIVQNATGGGVSPSSISVDSGENSPRVTNIRTVASGLSAGSACALFANSTTTAQLQFSAEL